jgi:hypothetical protein
MDRLIVVSIIEGVDETSGLNLIEGESYEINEPEFNDEVFTLPNK